MPFEKGNRANPGGRPRKTQEQLDFERKCREWAQLFALDNLKRAAKSTKAMESIAATKEILDRGFGKPEVVQYSEVNVTAESGSSAGEIEAGIADVIGKPANGSGEVAGKAEVDAGK